MTEQERRIAEEITARLEKKCGRRVSCKRCPRKNELLEFGGGCGEKVAIEMLIEARAATESSEWIKQIKEILGQYTSRADLEVFRAARKCFQYEGTAGVPLTTLTHLATIIAYCEKFIEEGLRK